MKTKSENLLLLTHFLDPDQSMESRLSWFRAVQAASKYRTTVICAQTSAKVIERFRASFPRAKIIIVPHTVWENLLIRWGAFYLAYRIWHGRVWEVAESVHARIPFALVHQVSYCGYREPGECWKLDAPFVWGPIGGTHNLPWRFLSTMGLLGALRESARTIINSLQLRFSQKVRRALQNSDVVLAANQELQEDFKYTHGIEIRRLLETGIEQVSGRKRPLRDTSKPLKILWAGRLESWKALPLLLEALARLKGQVDFELRVVGDGSLSRRWIRQAERLGLSPHVHWVGWPPYVERDRHYQWADVFAFTSLRDTSGTGLLESLAQGLPIIGVNHQGARDIMTPESCIPIEVSSPSAVVADFASAIKSVSQDPQKLKRLSDCALARAEEYLWSLNGQEMLEVYATVLGEPRIQEKLRLQHAAEIAESDVGSSRFETFAG